MWHTLPYHLGNSHILLYDHEISYVHTRHLELCTGVDPIHFSSVFILLWFFEVDPWLLTFFVLTWNYVDFLILIDYLPMIQLSWNLICMLCYGLWLSMKSVFVIFWSRVWQLVSHHECAISWILMTCFLTSNWPHFLHEPHFICLVDLWFFLELIVLFSICLRFFLPV